MHCTFLRCPTRGDDTLGVEADPAVRRGGRSHAPVLCTYHLRLSKLACFRSLGTMPSINDLTIVNSNTAAATKVEHGLLRTLCSPELCDSQNLTVYKRTIQKGKQYDLNAGQDYHL